MTCTMYSETLKNIFLALQKIMTKEDFNHLPYPSPGKEY